LSFKNKQNKLTFNRQTLLQFFWYPRSQWPCGCQVEVSAMGWSLIQRSPTYCGVSECDRKASIMRRPWPLSQDNVTAEKQLVCFEVPVLEQN